MGLFLSTNLASYAFAKDFCSLLSWFRRGWEGIIAAVVLGPLQQSYVVATFWFEVFCLQVTTQRVTFSCSRGTKNSTVAYYDQKFNRAEKKNSTEKKSKTDNRFCSVLFSFDRRFRKNLKTYRTSIFNSSSLYVFIFFWKRLSKENKTEQNCPSVGFASVLLLFM